ncbi:MAG: cysteine hydrolase family protein [Arenicellales bacterium]
MQKTGLLLIDVQKGLDDPSLGTRNNPGAEKNIQKLLLVWRNRGLPVVHIQHCSIESDSKLRPELPGNEIKLEAQPRPEETLFKKSVNSAFIGTGLEKYLRENEVLTLVIVGFTTDHCVSASTRMASDLGFEVTLVSDATAAFGRVGYDDILYSGEEIHTINLVSLDGEFCNVRSTEEVLRTIPPYLPRQLHDQNR